MTTIILSDTFIAHDHMVVSGVYPFRARTDPHHKKVFVSPCETFLIACDGFYEPTEVDKPEVFAELKVMLEELIKKCPRDDRFISTLNDKPVLDVFKDTFGESGSLLFVTSKHRFKVTRNKQKKDILASMCEDYVGLGSGGQLAEGLLEGGVAIHDIWDIVADLDNYSSSIHTVIPLDILKPWGE